MREGLWEGPMHEGGPPPPPRIAVPPSATADELWAIRTVAWRVARGTSSLRAPVYESVIHLGRVARGEGAVVGPPCRPLHCRAPCDGERHSRARHGEPGRRRGCTASSREQGGDGGRGHVQHGRPYGGPPQPYGPRQSLVSDASCTHVPPWTAPVVKGPSHGMASRGADVRPRPAARPGARAARAAAESGGFRAARIDGGWACLTG